MACGGRREPAIFGSVMIARNFKNWQERPPGKAGCKAAGEAPAPHKGLLHLLSSTTTSEPSPPPHGYAWYREKGCPWSVTFAQDQRQLCSSQNQAIDALLLFHAIDDDQQSWRVSGKMMPFTSSFMYFS